MTENKSQNQPSKASLPTRPQDRKNGHFAVGNSMVCVSLEDVVVSIHTGHVWGVRNGHSGADGKEQVIVFGNSPFDYEADDVDAALKKTFPLDSCEILNLEEVQTLMHAQKSHAAIVEWLDGHYVSEIAHRIARNLRVTYDLDLVVSEETAIKKFHEFKKRMADKKPAVKVMHHTSSSKKFQMSGGKSRQASRR